MPRIIFYPLMYVVGVCTGMMIESFNDLSRATERLNAEITAINAKLEQTSGQ